MAAHGKLAWFLIILCGAILVESQIIRPYVGQTGIQRRPRQRQTLFSSPRFGLRNHGTSARLAQPFLPSLSQRQSHRHQQPRRTTVLQQTLVVNDRSNALGSHQRRTRIGTGGGRRITGARRTGSHGALRNSFRRGPSVFSSGQRSAVGRAAVGRQPNAIGRNILRLPNHGRLPSQLNPLAIRQRQPLLVIPRGTGRVGTHVGGRHAGGFRQIGHSGIHPGVGISTGASAGHGHGNNLNFGAGAVGGGRSHAGGIAGDLGLNPATATNLLAAGMGMDLAEIGALSSLLGQSSQQGTVVNPLLGHGTQHSLQPSAHPTVPAISINAPPTGASPTSRSANPQVILGRILGDNRIEGAPGALQGDANEHLIERIRRIDPNLLPPDI